MGKSFRDKGARRERELVNLHRATGVKAERVPLSGAANYQGNGADIDVYASSPEAPAFVCEAKARGNGEGFVTLERWLAANDALFLIRDRAQPLVVLPWDRWVELVKRGAA